MCRSGDTMHNLSFPERRAPHARTFARTYTSGRAFGYPDALTPGVEPSVNSIDPAAAPKTVVLGA
eukprot:2030238-Alexandrium_andersonii.AAC.1